MGKFKDLTGMKFGRLTVIEVAGQNQQRNYTWKCRCDCGKEIITAGGNLTSGSVKSCGCLQKEIVSELRFDNLLGKTFGRLTVKGLVGKEGYNYLWKCQCECGNIVTKRSGDLRSGHVTSCGCLKRDSSSRRFSTHGLSKDRIYHVWGSIKRRCFNSNCKAYPRYGGRGITMHDEFKNNFQAFYDYVSTLEHFGEIGYTLDRINNDGNYERGNLRWATKNEQARNRRSNVFIESEGKCLTLAEVAEKAGVDYHTLQGRYKRGKRGDALLTPPRGQLIVEYNGEAMCLKDAARKSGLSYNTLRKRYTHGKRGADLFAPVNEKFSTKGGSK